MNELSITLLSGATALVALGIVSLAALRGWTLWIDLRRHEIERAPRDFEMNGGSTSTVNRIDLADLKERVRKLEAIAAGVDL